ncbi:MAG: response regulator [Candidatus Omnitrophota bacterium]
MDMKTVLVIDDAKEVRRLLRFYLEKKYKVLEAADGEKGLAMIFEKHPDLVILDINMPKMTGLELYRKVTSEKGGPFIPFIILTVREELGKFFKDLNVDGFITKPFDVEDVLREVDAVMEKRYNIPRKEQPKPDQGIKKILVIDDDAISLDKIATSFINAGYAVQSAQTVLAAFEKIMMDPPVFIAIKLGLPDISGDLVCIKLRQMPKILDIPLLLYMPAHFSFDHKAVQKICKVIDVELVETSDPEFLLEAMKKMFAIRVKELPPKKNGSSGGA